MGKDDSTKSCYDFAKTITKLGDTYQTHRRKQSKQY